MSKSKSKLTTVDVKIVDVHQLPAKYFMHDAVIDTLKQVIRSDVITYGQPVPPGARAVKGQLHGPADRAVKQQIFAHQFYNAIKRDWIVFFAIWLGIATVGLGLWLLGAL